MGWSYQHIQPCSILRQGKIALLNYVFIRKMQVALIECNLDRGQLILARQLDSQ